MRIRIPSTELGLCCAVAARASADPRTVFRVLRGEQVRGLVGGRIVRALREAGIEPRESARLALVRDDKSPRREP